MGNPLSYKYALPYIYSQYHIMREKCFLGHSQPLRGGGGGGGGGGSGGGGACAPQAPP